MSNRTLEKLSGGCAFLAVFCIIAAAVVPEHTQWVCAVGALGLCALAYGLARS